MRSRNDVAGLLFGDHASLWVTKLFVDLGVSPNVASVGFLVCGLLGAGLQVLSGPAVFAGALLLVLYYVLDCVDGEVARWQKVVAVHWGYYDYLFHMLIKPLTFLGVGLGTFIQLDQPWLLCAAFCAAVATLWLKLFLEIPGILFLREVLRRSQRGGGREGSARPVEVVARQTGLDAERPPFRLGFDLVTLRALATNFDIGLLLLLVAAAADLLLPAPAGVLEGLSWRALWLVYYGVVLPIDFCDYLFTYLRRGHFSTEMTKLLALAHHFRSDLPQERDCA